MISQSLNTHLCYPIKDKEAAKWPTHLPTHLDKNQNTHLNNFFHWTIHYPNIFLLYCLAIPKYWWYIISKNGISSSSYNSVSHWSCACFYFYFIWFRLMMNFQHPTVTKVVGWAESLKGYCFLNGESHVPSNYMYFCICICICIFVLMYFY